MYDGARAAFRSRVDDRSERLARILLSQGLDLEAFRPQCLERV